MKALFYIILSFVLFACSSEKYDLSLNLKDGKTYKQVTSKVVNLVTEIEGQKVNQNITITSIMSYKVLKVDKEHYEMEVKYKELFWRTLYSNVTFEYSTENMTADDPISIILRNLKNKPFQVKLSKKGRILDVVGLDEISDEIIADFTQYSEKDITSIRKELTKVVGAETLKGDFELVGAVFPEKEVQSGDSWNVDVELVNTLPKNHNTTYELSNISNKDYLLTGKSKITLRNSDYQQVDKMEVKYDLSGIGTSNIVIDKESGWLVEASINQELSGKTYVRSNYYLPSGGLFPVKWKEAISAKGN